MASLAEKSDENSDLKGDGVGSSAAPTAEQRSEKTNEILEAQTSPVQADVVAPSDAPKSDQTPKISDENIQSQTSEAKVDVEGLPSEKPDENLVTATSEVKPCEGSVGHGDSSDQVLNPGQDCDSSTTVNEKKGDEAVASTPEKTSDTKSTGLGQPHGALQSANKMEVLESNSTPSSASAATPVAGIGTVITADASAHQEKKAIEHVVVRVPLEMELPSNTSVEDIRAAVLARVQELGFETSKPIDDLVLAGGTVPFIMQKFQPFKALVPGSVLSLLENTSDKNEVASMGCGSCVNVHSLNNLHQQFTTQMNQLKFTPIKPITPMMMQPNQMMMQPNQMGVQPSQMGVQLNQMMMQPKPAVDPSQVFKTKMCTNFANGTCMYGARCTFAHSQKELRQPGPQAKPPGPGLVAPRPPGAVAGKGQPPLPPAKKVGEQPDNTNAKDSKSQSGADSWKSWNDNNGNDWDKNGWNDWKDWKDWKSKDWWNKDDWNQKAGEWTSGAEWKSGAEKKSGVEWKDMDSELDAYFGKDSKKDDKKNDKKDSKKDDKKGEVATLTLAPAAGKSEPRSSRRDRSVRDDRTRSSRQARSREKERDRALDRSWTRSRSGNRKTDRRRDRSEDSPPPARHRSRDRGGTGSSRKAKEKPPAKPPAAKEKKEKEKDRRDEDERREKVRDRGGREKESDRGGKEKEKARGGRDRKRSPSRFKPSRSRSRSPVKEERRRRK